MRKFNLFTTFRWNIKGKSQTQTSLFFRTQEKNKLRKKLFSNILQKWNQRKEFLVKNIFQLLNFILQIYSLYFWKVHRKRHGDLNIWVKLQVIPRTYLAPSSFVWRSYKKLFLITDLCFIIIFMNSLFV